MTRWLQMSANSKNALCVVLPDYKSGVTCGGGFSRIQKMSLLDWQRRSSDDVLGNGMIEG